jgi:GDP-4-dehydro-6-deoxy-D-mannose reductase
MRLLITGVAGFVAGHLVDCLRAARPDVELVGLDRPAALERAGLGRRVTCMGVDLEDATALARAVEKAAPDRVIHLAGQSSVERSWHDPGATLSSNVLGTLHLLEALRRHAPRARVLVVGSAEEYGHSAGAGPLSEGAPLRPSSPYAASKAAQGLLALEQARAGLFVVVTRTFNHTGPRRGAAFAESSFARQIAEIEKSGRPGRIEVGNLDAVRDFSDVREVVRVYWALLGSGSSGEVYNVCSGRGVEIRGLLEHLLRLAQVAIEVRVDPARLRPSDIPVQVGDPTKLEQAVGWHPSPDLDSALADLLDEWRRRVGG